MKDNEKNINGYGARDECDFLNRLGSHSIRGPHLDRTVLLRNYIDSTNQRAVWGLIDRRRVVDYAKSKLAELEAMP